MKFLLLVACGVGGIGVLWWMVRRRQHPRDHLPAGYLKALERGSYRNAFDGVGWNWRWLIAEDKRKRGEAA